MGKKYQITESQMKKIISHVKDDDNQELVKEDLKTTKVKTKKKPR